MVFVTDEGGWERADKWGPVGTTLLNQVHVTLTENRRDAAIVNPSTIQVPSTVVSLIEHLKERDQFRVGVILSFVVRRKAVEVSGQNNPWIQLRKRLYILLKQTSLFDPSLKVRWVKMDHIEPDALNAASQQTMMHAVANSFDISNGESRSNACGKSIFLQQNGMLMPPRTCIGCQLLRSVLVQFLQRHNIRLLCCHPFEPVCMPWLRLLREAVPDIMSYQLETTRLITAKRCCGYQAGRQEAQSAQV